jgi:feruloyl esterase
MKQKYPNVTIVSAVFMDDPRGFVAPSTPGVFGTPPGLTVVMPFCRVTGHINPVPGSHIEFEVWMPPAEAWNERYFAVGNPAFEGAIKYQGLTRAIAEGYAASSSDTGHQHPGHEWAMGHPERLVDWIHRATHESAVVAKRLIEAFYGRPALFSYWNSCHNGGRQGLVAAQRYPTDFDGIVAGNPAYYMTRLQTGSLYLGWVALKDGMRSPGFVPPSKYAVIHRAVLDACDELDGVKDDAIEDPTRCNFDPASIQCAGPDRPSCLTAAQVETVRRLYDGARFADGTQIYTGFEFGSELFWHYMLTGPEPLDINHGFFQYIAFENPDWDFRTFDVDRDTRDIEKRLGPTINSISTDLTAFRNNGGKLLIYHSWNETWIPPRMITYYYNDIARTMGGMEKTQDFARLFMVPGTGMCPADNNLFDALTAVRKWREEGIAPGRITATYRDRGQVYKTRPLCPFPQAAIYKGSGDTNDEANFDCGIPDW